MCFLSRFIRLLCAGLIFFSTFSLSAQEKSYKSLLWEISGNGLRAPSYLFGTMHISNKMVFHLSDSFYAAIKSADVVAIELNPEQWQHEIPRLNKQGEIYKYYNSTYYTDYLRENSFTEGDFLSQLQASLRFEPALNDALLYRNESRMDNFQEDTYLDLYIYQTGKKLGKQTAGVETYMGSQRMMVEAMVDAAVDKEKKRPDTDVPYYELGQVMQDAYRRGDLDMLDSINKLTEYTESFTEKFLYKRNEIQAASIDSIMRRQQRLFVGVGAAHLPGRRGVIEILRKKGYTLRPIAMLDRDATQKRYIDSLTVPVHFVRQYASDSFYSVSVPGELNDIAGRNDMSLKHYADMGNGSYYLITRIKTNTLFNGYTEQRLEKIVDSLLYENIPGTIIANKTLSKNGYSGIDILNRTRKGDLQHYQLWFTPSELLIFKMGGKGNYVEGKEADTFFASITLKEQAAGTMRAYTPASGGFTVNLPAEPAVFFTPSGNDQLPEWKYEATDPGSGDEYAIFKKSIYSFDFIEPDTFDLRLIAESFMSSPQWTGKKSYNQVLHHGRPAMDMALRTRDGDYIQARAVLFGPQYYLLIHRTKQKERNDASAFFNSFAFAPFHYPPSALFRDTTFHFSVRTSVKPALDEDVLDMMSYVKKSEPILKKEISYRGSVDSRTANFVLEQTGEVIVVNDYKYPEYYYEQDSAAFWKSRFYPDSSLMLHRKARLDKGPGTQAWLLEWADTGSTRLIRQMVLVKGMHMLTVNTVRDSTLPLSSFLQDFYDSFVFDGPAAPGLFTPKTSLFFTDYYSKDTLRSKKARSAITAVYYGREGYPKITEALQRLDAGQPEYYDVKSKLISALGYIRDSTAYEPVVHSLKELYLASGDTTLFQNNVLRALSGMPYGKAAQVFKELILQDPPAFENSYDYMELFSSYSDSLKLAAILYPEIMNLTTIEDFKQPVRELLAALVDSGYVQPSQYEEYQGNIYFDAKIALKKMQYSTESMLSKADAEQDESDDEDEYDASSNIGTYARLLAPFYNKNPNLPRFFDKLLSARDPDIRLDAALALLRYKQPVADSVWDDIAAIAKERYALWSRLRREGHPELFPAKYKTPVALAAGPIYASLGERLDTLVLLPNKPMVRKDEGITTYFFKYRLKKENNWKLAISSVSERKGKPAESSYDQLNLPDKKLAATTQGIEDQIGEQMKKIFIMSRSSGRQFYQGDGYTSAGDLMASDLTAEGM